MLILSLFSKLFPSLPRPPVFYFWDAAGKRNDTDARLSLNHVSILEIVEAGIVRMKCIFFREYSGSYATIESNVLQI